MESSTFTKPQPNLQTVSAPSSNQHRQTFAAERAELLFGGYRRGDANDPETYVASIAAVLSCYEPDVIREVTDPRTGISTQEKFRAFMPNSGELKAFCDHIANRQHRWQNFAEALPPYRPPVRPEPQPGDRAVCFVPATNIRYRESVVAAQDENADPRDWKYDHKRTGVWISLPRYEKVFRR